MHNAVVVVEWVWRAFSLHWMFFWVSFISASIISLFLSFYLYLSIYISSSVAHFSLWEIWGRMNGYKWGCLLEAAVASLLHLAGKEGGGKKALFGALKPCVRTSSMKVYNESVFTVCMCMCTCVLHLTASFQPRLGSHIYGHISHQVLFLSVIWMNFLYTATNTCTEDRHHSSPPYKRMLDHPVQHYLMRHWKSGYWLIPLTPLKGIWEISCHHTTYSVSNSKTL